MRRLLAGFCVVGLSGCAFGPPPARLGVTRSREDAALEAIVRDVLRRYDAVEAFGPARGGYCLALGRGDRDHALDPSSELLQRFADRGDVHGSLWCVAHGGRLLILQPIHWLDAALLEVRVSVRESPHGRPHTCVARAELRDERWQASCVER